MGSAVYLCQTDRSYIGLILTTIIIDAHKHAPSPVTDDHSVNARIKNLGLSAEAHTSTRQAQQAQQAL